MGADRGTKARTRRTTEAEQAELDRYLERIRNGEVNIQRGGATSAPPEGTRGGDVGSLTSDPLPKAVLIPAGAIGDPGGEPEIVRVSPYDAASAAGANPSGPTVEELDGDDQPFRDPLSGQMVGGKQEGGEKPGSAPAEEEEGKPRISYIDLAKRYAPLLSRIHRDAPTRPREFVLSVLAAYPVESRRPYVSDQLMNEYLTDADLTETERHVIRHMPSRLAARLYDNIVRGGDGLLPRPP